MAYKRKKKEVDFVKRKYKVGKKLKPLSETVVNFKSKGLSNTLKRNNNNSSEESPHEANIGKDKLRNIAKISRGTNVASKRDSLRALEKELEESKYVSDTNAQNFIRGLAPLVVDKSSEVRQDALTTFKCLLSNRSVTAFLNKGDSQIYSKLIIGYLKAAMTDSSVEVRMDALKFLSVISDSEKRESAEKTNCTRASDEKTSKAESRLSIGLGSFELFPHLVTILSDFESNIKNRMSSINNKSRKQNEITSVMALINKIISNFCKINNIDYNPSIENIVLKQIKKLSGAVVKIFKSLLDINGLSDAQSRSVFQKCVECFLVVSRALNSRVGACNNTVPFDVFRVVHESFSVLMRSFPLGISTSTPSEMLNFLMCNTALVLCGNPYHDRVKHNFGFNQISNFISSQFEHLDVNGTTSLDTLVKLLDALNTCVLSSSPKTINVLIISFGHFYLKLGVECPAFAQSNFFLHKLLTNLLQTNSKKEKFKEEILKQRDKTLFPFCEKLTHHMSYLSIKMYSTELNSNSTPGSYQSDFDNNSLRSAFITSAKTLICIFSALSTCDSFELREKEVNSQTSDLILSLIKHFKSHPFSNLGEPELKKLLIELITNLKFLNQTLIFALSKIATELLEQTESFSNCSVALDLIKSVFQNKICSESINNFGVFLFSYLFGSIITDENVNTVEIEIENIIQNANFSQMVDEETFRSILSTFQEQTKRLNKAPIQILSRVIQKNLKRCCDSIDHTTREIPLRNQRIFRLNSIVIRLLEIVKFSVENTAPCFKTNILFDSEIKNFVQSCGETLWALYKHAVNAADVIGLDKESLQVQEEIHVVANGYNCAFREIVRLCVDCWVEWPCLLDELVYRLNIAVLLRSSENDKFFDSGKSADTNALRIFLKEERIKNRLKKYRGCCEAVLAFE